MKINRICLEYGGGNTKAAKPSLNTIHHGVEVKENKGNKT